MEKGYQENRDDLDAIMKRLDQNKKRGAELKRAADDGVEQYAPSPPSQTPLPAGKSDGMGKF